MSVVVDPGVLPDRIGEAALRKTSWRLLPLLALGYGIAYMDRANIAFASLQMNRDLQFSATVYGLGGGLFFVSYALLEVPSNLLLVRFGAGRWLARIMLTWGLLAAGMMFVKTPMQFYVMRFLLGAAEAGFFPGVVFYLTLWFPAHYRGRAISRFYVAFPISSIVMGALAGALLDLQGRFGLAGWQWLFLVEGLPAVALSVVIFLCLPDNPSDARWLTDAERGWIADQLSGERAHHQPGNVMNALRALRDPRVRQIGLANICIMGATYAATLSAPAVLEGVTRWPATAIGFLVSIAYVFGAIGMVWNGWRSDNRRERYLHTAIPLVGLGVGSAAMGLSNSAWVVASTYVLTVACAAASQAAFWLIPSDEFKGPLAEVGVAAIGSIGMIGAFLGPSAFGVARDYTGGYTVGMLAVGGTYLVGAAIILYSRRTQAHTFATPAQPSHMRQSSA